MAITDINGIIAGAQPPRFFGKAVTGTMVAGRPRSLWALAGNPGAGTFDTTLNGVTLTSPASGQLPFTNPASGNSYLTRFQGQATIAGTLILADRIWHNGGYTITSNSAQNSTTPTWPARDVNGSTDGDGIILGLEISAAAGAASPTITIAYTNSAGASGRTATNWFPTANSPAAGSFFPIGLQAGDTGVRSVQSLTLSVSWASGTMNLVAYRPIVSLEITQAQYPSAVDCFTSGMPRLYDGTVPFLIFVPNTTTTSNISGSFCVAQG